MAKATGVSHMTINRIWRAFGLKPHRTEAFQLSPDPLLIDKVRDIVGHVLESAGSRGGPVRRRQAADPGARSDGAAAAAQARSGGATHA